MLNLDILGLNDVLINRWSMERPKDSHLVSITFMPTHYKNVPVVTDHFHFHIETVEIKITTTYVVARSDRFLEAG